jgi:hypothetical protein
VPVGETGEVESEIADAPGLPGFTIASAISWYVSMRGLSFP